MTTTVETSAATIARAVRTGTRLARDVVHTALNRIEREDGCYGSFTRRFGDKAMADAERIDALVRSRCDPGPLAGVPFGVKDLFDIAGVPTTAGAGFRKNARQATADAAAIRRLKEAGAVLVGTCNMDEFAYGFATINATFGATRNPHDPARLAGGSSGGSAAAVAAGLVPFSLGSDTNGSIRVPASLCGIYGLRPTHGLLGMTGIFPFVESLDVVGPLAGSLEDLATIFEILGGTAHSQFETPIRVARLGGWFDEPLTAEASAAVNLVADALGGIVTVELPAAKAARSAAFILTASEGGGRHLDDLRRQPLSFDPATRDPLIAGATIAAPVVAEAQSIRLRFTAQIFAMLSQYDVLVAAATPCVAPLIDPATFELQGEAVSARANLGVLTQPLSLAGVPALCVPVQVDGGLPIGVQLIARHGREAILFTLAGILEQRQAVRASLTSRKVRY